MNRGPREPSRGGAPSSEGATREQSRDSRGPRGRPQGGPRKQGGRGPSDFRMRLERLRGAREPDEIREATDAFLQHHQMPDDIDVLYKILLHPNEKVLREALGQISSLIMQGRVSSGKVLEERLSALGERASEPATRSFIDGVRAQLERAKSKSP